MLKTRIFLLFFFFSLIISAQKKDDYQKVNEEFNKNNFHELTFNYQVKNPDNNLIIGPEKGVIFTNKNQFRLVLNNQTIIGDGIKTYIINHEDQEITVERQSEDYINIQKLISKENYDYEIIKRDKKIILKPKYQSSFLESNLSYNQNYQITSIKQLYSDKSILMLTDINYNKVSNTNIPIEKFRFNQSDYSNYFITILD